MRNLNAADMLNVWEQGLNQSLLQRALIFLVAAFPEMEPDTLAKMSIGQRDQCLLQLRARLFGQRLVNTSVCPECFERMEWENRITDFLLPATATDNTQIEEFAINLDDYTIRFHLPNSLDIAHVLDCNDATTAQKNLLSCCILTAEYAGEDYAVNQLPEYVTQAIIQRIETLDPQAEIQINLHCPQCSHSWNVLFDIASFLWTELNDWAEQTLQMIHKLATGYGWTEQEILDLSPVRRQLYLGMLGA